MNSSDEEVLLESHCFLLNHHQDQIKRKWNRTRVREMFKKREQNKEFTLIYCRRWVSMIVNGISGYLHNERLSVHYAIHLIEFDFSKSTSCVI